MLSRVVLVRHGRSAHVQSGWVTSLGFRAWRDAYEAAGIRDDERVPIHLQHYSGEAGLVVSSNAPRAMGSARLLSQRDDVTVSPLLRELDLESPDLGGIKLPLTLWGLVVGLRVLSLKLRQRFPSPEESARIENAAQWLEELARDHPLIVAVTHAGFRRELSARLARRGWHSEPGRRSFRHWSTWTFRRQP